MSSQSPPRNHHKQMDKIQRVYAASNFNELNQTIKVDLKQVRKKISSITYRRPIANSDWYASLHSGDDDDSDELRASSTDFNDNLGVMAEKNRHQMHQAIRNHRENFKATTGTAQSSEQRETGQRKGLHHLRKFSQATNKSTKENNGIAFKFSC